MNDIQRASASVLSWLLLPATAVSYGAWWLLTNARESAGEQFAPAFSVLAGVAFAGAIVCVAGFLALRLRLIAAKFQKSPAA